MLTDLTSSTIVRIDEAPAMSDNCFGMCHRTVLECDIESKLAQPYPCGALLLTGCGADVKLPSNLQSGMPPAENL